MMKSIRHTYLPAALMMVWFLSACGDTSSMQGNDRSAGERETEAPELTEASAREVLKEVYRPIRTFYEEMVPTAGGMNQPPEGMHTPQKLQETLEQTMSPEVARPYTEQLLMEVEGQYIVRPTEKIITPFQDGPALESVTVEKRNGQYLVTEDYEETELYGDVVRENVLRWEDGRWKLVEIRFSVEQR